MWRERGSSPGFGPRCSPSRLLIRSVAMCEQALCPLQWRGRTGMHRFPCPAFAFSCLSVVEANLGRALPGGKHGAPRLRCRRPMFFTRRVEVALVVPTNIRDL